ncbi:T6SS phospholipase effector Tle1-like catalytic domain-containing protein [Pantoea stewartii]|uniref:T6SS phospholipase effector Tle1-like catalytic domain-containing protein n=1 Tax=Pantoea stewartii TaxID=66269 RepID=UPI0015627171|nr:DUF2235 domain-containing protein [Pantoea stewartii]NRH24674.1 hypothetical protein [Pantoea stewartii]
MNPSPNETSERCVIRIGVFFDGTGKNGNANKSEQDVMFCATNVYRLYQHYGLYADDSKGSWTGKVYVEGIGTLNNEPDSLYSIATGDEDIWGRQGYGPDSKLNLCHERIKSELINMLSKADSGCKSVCIEFDVFGFSRGAVLARHFTNTVNDQAAELSVMLSDAVNKCGYQLSGRPVVNFLGLFDTVGSFMDKTAFSNDPHDTAYTRNLKVTVPGGAAKYAFQLNALHECRYNLSLHTLSGCYPELTIAGAHSDVGGGYPETLNEHQKVSDRFFFPFHWAKTRVENELHETLYSEKWRLLKGRISFQGSERWHSIATSERVVKGHLQFIAFLVMVMVSEKYGCTYHPDYKKYESLIPDALKEYHQHVMSAAQDALEGKSPQLDKTLINKVMPDYVHLSASWETLADMYGDLRHNREMLMCSEEESGNSDKVIDLSIMNNFWPNRPDENWKRKIFG